MKTLIAALLLILAVLGFSLPAWAVTINLYPIHDAEIVWSLGTGSGGSILSGTNFGNSQYLSINNGAPNNPTMYIGANSYGLVRFDLSSIPSGALINSSTLRLFHLGNTGFSGRTISLYPISSGWDEATVTYNSRPSWAAGAVSSLVIPDAFANQYRSWDVTGITQEWIDGTSNFGLITSDLHVNPTSTSRNWIRFYSSEVAGTNFDPRLQIDYSLVPEPSVFTLFGIGLIGLVRFLKKS